MTDGDGGIDWGQVKERLKKAEAGLGRAYGIHPSRARAIMRRRAARLAARGRKEKEAALPLSLLQFRLGGETFAVELGRVAEVATRVAITPIPGASPELLGVANLHGEIRPVLDTAMLIGLPAWEEGDMLEAVVYLRREVGEIGIRVDAVDRVREIDKSEIGHPGGENAMMGPFVAGVTDDLTILLDAGGILEPPIAGSNGRGDVF